jgi:hypothetical protein
MFVHALIVLGWITLGIVVLAFLLALWAATRPWNHYSVERDHRGTVAECLDCGKQYQGYTAERDVTIHASKCKSRKNLFDIARSEDQF